MAAVWLVGTRKHLHKGRLAGTVVTNQTDDLTRVQLEAGPVERNHRTVSLRNVFYFIDNFAGH